MIDFSVLWLPRTSDVVDDVARPEALIGERDRGGGGGLYLVVGAGCVVVGARRRRAQQSRGDDDGKENRRRAERGHARSITSKAAQRA